MLEFSKVCKGALAHMVIALLRTYRGHYTIPLYDYCPQAGRVVYHVGHSVDLVV